MASDTERPTNLLEQTFDWFFLMAWNKLVSFIDWRASIPAQQRVIIAERTDRFCFLKPDHRFAKQLVSLKPTIRRSLSQLRFGSPFVEDSSVISAFVFGCYSRQQFLRLCIADAVALFKTIGQRQQKSDDRLLIFGVDVQNIETDAFRLARFVEQPIPLRFFQRGGNVVLV